ncbi:MAG: hypothetical protein KAR42_05240 [candidate division Zixibacteria bacterium]|nr:hypothetical protein [candidate division Zixibacteria bacterium]
MIFFIIDKRKRATANFGTITQSAPGGRLRVSSQFMILISWNEVTDYSDLSKLEAAVIAEARNDPMCIDMRKNAIAQYGIDPLLKKCGGGNLNQETMTSIRNKIFMSWAHPMIGNIGLSPRVRPEIFYHQYLENWDSCTYLDGTTKKKIKELFQVLQPMGRSSRDQVRICYNITELARSIIGEITSVTSRRLDKIFALQLCQSDTLKTKQILIIKRIIDRLDYRLKDGFKNTAGFKQSEYIRYYMPDILKTVMRANSYEPQWYLYEKLIRLATDNWYKITSTYTPTDATGKIIDAAIADWKKFPDPVKCAILINSFRRFVWVVKNHKKYSMALKNHRKMGTKPFKSSYTIHSAAGNDHVPEISFNSKDRSLAWSWNRDEYHAATKTYRHFLMNLWGGPSGHARGNVEFMSRKLGYELPYNGPNWIITGLFVFWRLYYDKRVSVVHTLAETMEASITFGGFTERSQCSYTINTIPDVTTDDAYDIITACTLAGRGKNDYKYIDPVKLMQTLRKKYYDSTLNHQEAYENLLTQINTLRKNLTDAGYNVPQWSKAISSKQGMRVISFSDRDSNAKSELSDTLFIRAMFNKVHSNLIDRALKEQ